MVLEHAQDGYSAVCVYPTSPLSELQDVMRRRKTEFETQKREERQALVEPQPATKRFNPLFHDLEDRLSHLWKVQEGA